MTTIEKRTPEETPAAIARTIAALATAPTDSFGAVLNDDDRDRQYQRLVARLTAADPTAWSGATENDVEERLGASLSTEDDRTLFGQHLDDCTTKGSIRENAAYLVGLEVGRRQTPPLQDRADGKHRTREEA